MNTCVNSGRLVSGKEPIPTAAYDYVWPQAVLIFGCNQLTCRSCGQRVKTESGYNLGRHPSKDDCLTLARSDDWATLIATGLLSEHEGDRVYACHCGAMSVHRWQDIRDDRMPYVDHPPPGGWHCAGHPRLSPPIELDGERIEPENGFDALALGVLTNKRAVSCPDPFDSYPSAWLQRAYYLLAHRPEAAALSRAIASLLSVSDFGVVSSALDFHFLIPGAPGGEAIVSLTDDHTQPWRDRATSFRRRLRFGHLVQLALAGWISRQASLPSDCTEAARRAILWPYKGSFRLLEALSRLDTDWIRDNASAILVAKPERLILGSLIRVLEEPAVEDFERAIFSLWQTGALSRADFEKVLRQELDGPRATAIIAGLRQR